MFLESEQLTNHIETSLNVFEKQLKIATNHYKSPNNADLIYKFLDQSRLGLAKGHGPTHLTVQSLGLSTTYTPKKWHILIVGGRPYFTKKIQFQDSKNSFLYLWEFDINKNFNLKNYTSQENNTYILSQESRIIFKNNDHIDEDSASKRHLVQKFKNSPVSQSQIKFEVNDQTFYGFFSVIHDSNLILFSEINESRITKSIFKILKTFFLAVLASILLTVLALQLLLPSITSPLKELVHISRMLSMGRFRFNTSKSGFGEVAELTKAFTKMGQSLETRDKEIMTLLKDKEERARLDHELLIAKKIQENFLPKQQKSPKNGVYVGSFYRPADEVAGDWYQHFYDKKTDEFISILADVSGHGAGASMFTAVIAAQFENFKISRTSSDDIFKFIKHLNEIFRNLGKGEWHATLIIGIVSHDRRKITLINCGHPFPLMLSRKNQKNKLISIKLPSTPIGLDENISIAHKHFEIIEDTSILFFTDGIIEAENPDEKPYGRKKLSIIFESLQDLTPQSVIDHIFNDWLAHIKTQKPNDDICLYSLGISP